MLAYLYVAKMRILTSLAYRFEVFTALGSNLVLMLATVFLWQAAYNGIDTVAGVNQNQIITYAIVSGLLTAVFSCQTQNMLNERVREGAIAIDLIRPSNLLLFYLSEDIGNATSALFNKLIPLLIFASVFVKVPLPQSVGAFLLFLLSCSLSFIILWLLSALIGMTAFWFLELGNLGIVKDAVVRILSGSLVPLWFFPSGVQKVSAYLPFIYTHQTPISIYIGKISTRVALNAMLIQGIWIFILTAVLIKVWSKAQKKVLVQGG